MFSRSCTRTTYIGKLCNKPFSELALEQDVADVLREAEEKDNIDVALPVPAAEDDKDWIVDLGAESLRDGGGELDMLLRRDAAASPRPGADIQVSTGTAYTSTLTLAVLQHLAPILFN